jgi:uncharacterized membrane protein YkoI
MKHYFIAGAAGAVLALATVGTVGVATAQEQKMLSPQDVIEKLEKEFGGKVTDFELDRGLLGDIYEVEVIDRDGREWDVDVDARTGEILRKHEDRD